MSNLPRSIAEASQLIKSAGAETKGVLVEGALQKIAELVHLNAFTFVRGRREALQGLQQVGSTRPLEGIPIAVKDNFCVKGMPTTCGSNMLHSFMPPYTATVVQRLMDAGAVIVGKTNMDEFGMGNGTVDSVFGPTKNIWGLEQHRRGDCYEDWRVPGGSSGGSAVAVASGACLGALGSDTGGSTRNPASYCGVYGLKPTYGSLSRHGLIPLVNSMDVPGLFSRSVNDLSLLYDSIKGWDPLDSTSCMRASSSSTTPSEDGGGVKGLRIGLPQEYHCPGLSPEVAECWAEVAALLSREGAEVSQVSLPHTKYSIVCYSVLNCAEVASNMARYDGLRYGHRSRAADKDSSSSTESLYAQTRHEGFNAVVRGRILAGNYFLLKGNYEKYFVQALKVRRLILEDFERVWKKEGVDVLLSPVTLSTAPTHSDFIKWGNREQSSTQDYCTQSANMAGIPALSVPIKLSKEGLPISLQLIGQRFQERVLFEVAKRIEMLTNFPCTNAN